MPAVRAIVYPAMTGEELFVQPLRPATCDLRPAASRGQAEWLPKIPEPLSIAHGKAIKSTDTGTCGFGRPLQLGSQRDQHRIDRFFADAGDGAAVGVSGLFAQIPGDLAHCNCAVVGDRACMVERVRGLVANVSRAVPDCASKVSWATRCFDSMMRSADAEA
jgi:hypothetical protein